MQIDSKAGDILLNKIGGCGFGALIKLGVENAYFDLSFHSSLLRFSWWEGELEGSLGCGEISSGKKLHVEVKDLETDFPGEYLSAS